jgi:hypothetical protein
MELWLCRIRRKGLKMDFIDRYVSLFKGEHNLNDGEPQPITDASPDIQEAVALFLESTCVGRNWYFFSAPETPIFSNNMAGGRILNLWFIIVGKTRLTRKTSAISKAEDLLESVKIDDRRLTNSFTPEYLVSDMASKVQGGESKCYWISDEISSFFEDLKRKDYMSSTDAVLSVTYDGRTYSRGTKTAGKEVIRNPYLTVLLASTDYLPSLFDKNKIRQGFLNRFNYVVVKPEKRRKLRTTKLTTEEQKEVEYIKAFLGALVNRTEITIVSFRDKAKEVYDKFEEECENKIMTGNLDVKEGYCGNLPNFCIRLSCLYRIARMSLEEIKNSDPALPLVVEKEDVEKAIVYTKKSWGWFEEIIKLMKQPTSKPILTDEEEIDFVYNIIADCDDEGCTTTILYRKTNYHEEKLARILHTLVAQGRALSETKETGGKGRPAIIWRVVK